MRLLLFFSALFIGLGLQAQVVPGMAKNSGEVFSEAIVTQDPLPDGISITTVTVNPDAPEHIKEAFYKKSNGAASYTVYNNEKGEVVPEDEVTYLKEKAKMKDVSPFMSTPPISK